MRKHYLLLAEGVISVEFMTFLIYNAFIFLHVLCELPPSPSHFPSRRWSSLLLHCCRYNVVSAFFHTIALFSSNHLYFFFFLLLIRLLYVTVGLDKRYLALLTKRLGLSVCNTLHTNTWTLNQFKWERLWKLLLFFFSLFFSADNTPFTSYRMVWKCLMGTETLIAY